VGGGGKFLCHLLAGHSHAVYFVVARGAERMQRAGGLLRPGVTKRRLDPQFIPVDHHQHGVDTVHAGA